MNLPLVLEIALGLVFTYLILSLLASELQELLATLLQWRAKHLRDAIEVFLAGGINTPEEAKVRELVDRLYNDPLLRNINQEAKGLIAGGVRQFACWLMPNNRSRTNPQQHRTIGPSYIAPETFATALLERLGLHSLLEKLTEIRLEHFVQRLVGTYASHGLGHIHIPSDAELKNHPTDWEKGSIRLIMAKAQQHHLCDDLNFRALVEECDGIVRSFKNHQASLNTCIERLGEELDLYIAACAQRSPASGQNPLALTDSQPSSHSPDNTNSPYVQRLQSLKLNIFGEKGERAIAAGGLQPSLLEMAELVNHQSAIYQEVAQAQAQFANQARPIVAQVQAHLQEQLDTYNANYQHLGYGVGYGAGISPQKPRTVRQYCDLPYALQQIFLDNALSQLSQGDRQHYENYQAFRQIRDTLGRLPDAVKDSMAILARRAQTRQAHPESQLHQFREEIALWFDRSMTRASGVYKRNAKGVALIIGVLIAVATNADTFHIVSRLSSDGNLRKLITDRATELNLDTARSPRLSEQLTALKTETDAVLQDIAFPISWTPTNLSRQLGCQSRPAPALATPSSDSQSWLALTQACLTNQSGNTTSTESLLIQIPQMMIKHPLTALRMGLGWLISGIAIAMGSPFWFDLMGKLVNVRNVGQKPKPQAAEEQPLQ